MSGLSVVVPAHNEEHALARCLSALLDEPAPFDLQLIVVANGCQDRTAAVARAHGTLAASLGVRLDVIELPEGGKPKALNAGDQVALHGDRAYLDADVVIDMRTLHDVQQALAGGVGLVGLRISPPRLTGRWLSDGYAAVWAASPAVTSRVIGAGFYAVTEAGRARWDRFPPIISDDKFVRLHFAPDEQRLLSASMVLTFPTDPRELLAVRGRWTRGNRQVTALLPEQDRKDRRVVMLARTAWCVAARPRLWRHAPAAALVYAAGWWLGRRPVVPGVWERAGSSGSRAA